MPAVEIEIREDGSVGTLPDPVQKFFDQKFKEAYGKGAEKAAAEARAQVEAEIARARSSSGDPVERERLKALELENSKLREAEALRDKNYDEAAKQREARYQADLAERDAKIQAAEQDIERRTARIRDLVAAEIRVAAIRQGARDESLPELDVLLSRRIGLNDALEAFVQDTSDPTKPALEDGKAVTIEGLVAKYLAEHPHHRAAAPGRGGKPAGGRSLSGQVNKGQDADRMAALDTLASDPSIANAATYISRIRARATA